MGGCLSSPCFLQATKLGSLAIEAAAYHNRKRPIMAFLFAINHGPYVAIGLAPAFVHILLQQFFKAPEGLPTAKKLVFYSLVPTFSYPCLVQLLQFSCYSKCVLSGLVDSVGGLQNSLKKATLSALLEYLKGNETADKNESSSTNCMLYTDLLWILQQYKKCDRVIIFIPTLKTIGILFSKSILLNMKNHTPIFCAGVLDSLEIELKWSKDFSKLYTGIALLGYIASVSEPINTHPFSQLLTFLTHWYPNIQKVCANLHYSKYYHPGYAIYTEGVNGCLETYVRCMTSQKPSKWQNWLALVGGWYNTNHHVNINLSPFQASYGYTPPQTLIHTQTSTFVDALEEMFKEEEVMVRILKDKMENAKYRSKLKAARKRVEKEIARGDWVYLHVQPYRQTAMAIRRYLNKISINGWASCGNYHLPCWSLALLVLALVILTLLVIVMLGNGRRIYKRHNKPAVQVLIQWSTSTNEEATGRVDIHCFRISQFQILRTRLLLSGRDYHSPS